MCCVFLGSTEAAFMGNQRNFTPARKICDDNCLANVMSHFGTGVKFPVTGVSADPQSTQLTALIIMTKNGYWHPTVFGKRTSWKEAYNTITYAKRLRQVFFQPLHKNSDLYPERAAGQLILHRPSPRILECFLRPFPAGPNSSKGPHNYHQNSTSNTYVAVAT